MFKTPRLTFTLLAVAALAGCSSTPLTPPSTSSSTAAPMTPADNGATASQSGVATVTLDPLDDPKSDLAARSVYFAFDDFSVDPKYQPLVQAHGRYLQDHPQVQVRVEGNTDERGSHEYNLSLGDKRAQVVAKQLKLMGAKDSQVEAVSFGSERPKDEGHDEAAWAENRRDDIRYVKR